MISETIPEGAELRASPRHRVFKGAVIVLNEGRSTFNCIMRDLSLGGARIQVESPLGLPDHFDLLTAETPRRPCRVAWRSGQQMGIAFLAAA
jgi:hypothetical protein